MVHLPWSMPCIWQGEIRCTVEAWWLWFVRGSTVLPSHSLGATTQGTTQATQGQLIYNKYLANWGPLSVGDIPKEVCVVVAGRPALMKTRDWGGYPLHVDHSPADTNWPDRSASKYWQSGIHSATLSFRTPGGPWAKLQKGLQVQGGPWAKLQKGLQAQRGPWAKLQKGLQAQRGPWAKLQKGLQAQRGPWAKLQKGSSRTARSLS